MLGPFFMMARNDSCQNKWGFTVEIAPHLGTTLNLVNMSFTFGTLDKKSPPDIQASSEEDQHLQFYEDAWPADDFGPFPWQTDNSVNRVITQPPDIRKLS